jgi:hypothetical protein
LSEGVLYGQGMLQCYNAAFHLALSLVVSNERGITGDKSGKLLPGGKFIQCLYIANFECFLRWWMLEG